MYEEMTLRNIYEIPVIMELRMPDSLNSSMLSKFSSSSSSESSIMIFDVSLACGYQFPSECKLKELWDEYRRNFLDPDTMRPTLLPIYLQGVL
jgi:hypothetical protein